MTLRPRPSQADDQRSRAGRRGVSALLRGPGTLAVGLLVVVAAAGFAGGRIAASAALFSDTASPDPVAFATAPDWVAPTTDEATIAVDGGALPAGTVYRGTTYRTYANVTDDGGVPSGVGVVTADVSAITAGATAVVLSAGSWTVDGTTYAWRSGPVVAATSLAPGTAAWSVTAVDVALNSRTQPFSVVIDTAGPTVSASVIAPTSSTIPGFIRQGGGYQVYALVSDPVAAITAVTANLGTITTGGSAVALTTSGGPWVVGGTSYNYRSASQTANAVLAAGPKSYTLEALDALGTSGSGSGSVTVDNTGPAVTPIAMLPETGATVPGFIRQGTAYRVYVTATDASAGVTSVTADVSTVSAGQTAVALTRTGGPWIVNGVSHAWRSAPITADAAVPAGARSWSATALDSAGNGGSLTGSVIVDNTAPILSGTAVARATGANGGFLSRSTGFYLYANATDATAGIGRIQADASTLSTGQAAVTLSTTGGPWTVNAISYSHRSPLLTTDASLADGARTVPFSAWDNAGGSVVGSAGATVDGTAPVVSAAQIVRTTGVAPGYIKRSTAFYVYATVSDLNLSTVTANVSAIRTGSTAVALTTTGGPWTVAGITYTHRSASTTASGSIVDGSVAWTLTATDLATNSTVHAATAIVDNTAPVRTAGTVAPSVGAATPGFIRQGATYHVYAAVSDAGSGVATVTANAGSLTSGATAVALSTAGGPWTIGSTTFTHRSALLTANAAISAGSKNLRITAVDNLATSGNRTFSVTVDNTAPAGTTSVIAKATGLVGVISSGTTYHVYANASDPSGIAALTADVSAITSGTTVSVLTTAGGPWLVGGTSYAWRSAPMVADLGLVNGTAGYALSVRDNASNSAVPAFTVTIDNASPGADASARGVRVSLLTVAGSRPAGVLSAGGRYRLFVRIEGAPRVVAVSVDASALATGTAAPRLRARPGSWVVGRTTWGFRTHLVTISDRALGSLPVVVRIRLADGSTLVSTLAVPVRARPGTDPGTGTDPEPTTGPTPSPAPSPDPGTDPSPAPSPDPSLAAPGDEATPVPDPTPTPPPTPGRPVEPTPTPMPESTPTSTPGPVAEPTPAPDGSDLGPGDPAP